MGWFKAVWSSANFFPWIYSHSDINNIPWSKKESAAVHDFKPEHAENFHAFWDLVDWENSDKLPAVTIRLLCYVKI